MTMKCIAGTVAGVWLLALAGFVGAAAPDAEPAAAEWPMFQRDVQRTGACKAPPLRTPRVLWRADVGIMGYLNGPVLAADKVFVASSGTLHNRPDAKDGIYALDRATGRVLWHVRTRIDACGVAWADGRVLATGDDGLLRCLAAGDGKVLWTQQRKGELYSMPLVLGGRVFVGDASGTVLAVDVKTGKIAWTAKPATSNVRGGLASDGKRLFASFREGKVVCLSQDGTTLWVQSLFDPNERKWWNAYPAPTVVGGKVYVGFARDTTYPEPAMRCLDALTGRPTWRTRNKDFDEKSSRTFANIRSSPAVWGELLVYGEAYGNTLMALARSDGAVKWTMEIGAPMFPHWPSPAVASATLYLPRHDGGLYAVDLKTRQLRWMLYLGDRRKVAGKLPGGLMPGRWGHCAWKPAVGQPLFASPAIGADGTLYVGSGEGVLYAVGEDKQSAKP